MLTRYNTAGRSQRKIEAGREKNGTGLLRKVQGKGRDQKPHESYSQEQEACYNRHMPQMRDKGIQDREELDSVLLSHLTPNQGVKTIDSLLR